MEICENMKKLRSYLDEKKIKWVDHSSDLDSLEKDMFICRTWLWIGERKISVVNGFGTYGGIHLMYGDYPKNHGLLEIMVDGMDDVIGNLTSDDVIKIIELIEKFGNKTPDQVIDEFNKIGE